VKSARDIAVWLLLTAFVVVPIVMAANSPLLQWREPIYIAAGFAGITALFLMLVQPLLIGGSLPGLSPARSRALHRLTGVALFALVVAHVTGLWITSPPDVIDALTFASPTPFSAWGVVAMWAVFGSVALLVLRNRMRRRRTLWRRCHVLLAIVIAVGTVVHALLIEGTMQTASKILLCIALSLATVKTLVTLKVWRK